MIKIITAAAACTLISAASFADEVWTTPIGDVIYERDLETGHAVLSYPTDDNAMRGLAYINDLAGQYTQRGAFTGVWIEDEMIGGEACDVSIADPETGEPRSHWGRVDLIFTEADFPGGWVAIRGDCFEQPENYLIGKPVTAESASQ